MLATNAYRLSIAEGSGDRLRQARCNAEATQRRAILRQPCRTRTGRLTGSAARRQHWGEGEQTHGAPGRQDGRMAEWQNGRGLGRQRQRGLC